MKEVGNCVHCGKMLHGSPNYESNYAARMGGPVYRHGKYGLFNCNQDWDAEVDGDEGQIYGQLVDTRSPYSKGPQLTKTSYQRRVQRRGSV